MVNANKSYVTSITIYQVNISKKKIEIFFFSNMDVLFNNKKKYLYNFMVFQISSKISIVHVSMLGLVLLMIV